MLQPALFLARIPPPRSVGFARTCVTPFGKGRVSRLKIVYTYLHNWLRSRKEMLIYFFFFRLLLIQKNSENSGLKNVLFFCNSFLRKICPSPVHCKSAIIFEVRLDRK